jgi:hypothetical protein
LVPHDAERRHEEPRAEARGRREHRLPRADAFEPRAEHGRGQPEEDDGNAEHPRDGGLAPVGGVGVVGSGEGRQRDLEDAERVRLADGEVDGQRRGRYEPAVEARRGDDPPSVEEPGVRGIAGHDDLGDPGGTAPTRTIIGIASACDQPAARSRPVILTAIVCS